MLHAKVHFPYVFHFFLCSQWMFLLKAACRGIAFDQIVFDHYNKFNRKIGSLGSHIRMCEAIHYDLMWIFYTYMYVKRIVLWLLACVCVWISAATWWWLSNDFVLAHVRYFLLFSVFLMFLWECPVLFGFSLSLFLLLSYPRVNIHILYLLYHIEHERVCNLTALFLKLRLYRCSRASR